MGRRPTFFISSTIYDFRDLRGAIKAVLENRGCKVLASEFNDFGTNLEKHSYDACLEQIAQADHFVLLIGGRVGAWFDEPKRISITQQEYRIAYERHKAGHLKIITLVRDEVWQLKEDRKALAKFLEQMELADAEKHAIKNFPSKFANDAEFISAFLLEVGRNRETGRAVRDGTAKPTGNWISVFKDFRDVLAVVEPLAFTGLTSDEAAYRKALQHEIIEMVRRLTILVDGQPWDPREVLRNHWEESRIDADALKEEFASIEARSWRSFSTLMMHMLALKFDVIVVEDALTSTIFLEYEGASGSYVQSDAYKALYRFIEEIRRFNKTNNTETLSLIFEYSPKRIGRPEGTLRLPAQKLATLHSLALRWINLISLGVAIARHLEGHPFLMPELMPLSPVHGMEEKIQAEKVTAEQCRALFSI